MIHDGAIAVAGIGVEGIDGIHPVEPGNPARRVDAAVAA
jgi:hypothetical protein